MKLPAIRRVAVLLSLLLMRADPAFGEASAASKQALLIANADYAHFGKLPNPISDARQLAGVLRQLGFSVSLVENASREGMLDALGAFEERLKASRGVAFFHYGGHGVQVDGKNFLIPADADIPDEKRVATRAVELDEVMAALDASGSDANIVVMDACRDNPLPATSSRSATRGLSVVAKKPKNSIIIYAAEADCKAQDGLFTPALARALASSGKTDISEVMKQVRREVYEASGGTQTPGQYDQSFGRIALGDESANLPPTPLPSSSAPAIASLPTPARAQPQETILAYYELINAGNYRGAWNMLPENLQENRKVHPNGFSSFEEWFGPMKPIAITDARVLQQTGDEASIEVSLRCTINRKTSSMALRYALVWDLARQEWRIQSIKKAQ